MMAIKLDMTNLSEGNAQTTPDQPKTVKDLVDQVRRDSVKNSKEYLDETTVPHGGE